jgi:hypothetical protein
MLCFIPEVGSQYGAMAEAAESLAQINPAWVSQSDSSRIIPHTFHTFSLLVEIEGHFTQDFVTYVYQTRYKSQYKLATSKRENWKIRYENKIYKVIKNVLHGIAASDV